MRERICNWTNALLTGAALALVNPLPRALADGCGWQPMDQIGGQVDLVGMSGTRTVFVQGADFVVSDVSNIGNPQVIGRLQLTDSVLGLTVSGSVAYLANGDGGLQMIDFSDPAAPITVGRLGGLRATDVQVVWPYAYVVDSTSWTAPVMRIFSVQDPDNPIEVASQQTPYDGLRRAGNRMYAWSTTAGAVGIYSIVDPANPQYLGTFNAAEQVRDVAASGTTVFVACGAEGVKSFNANNPAAVTPLGTRDNGTAYRIVVSGTRALVGDFEDLDVVNISNPAAMTIAGTYAPADDFTPRDLALLNNDVVVAAGSRLQIVSYAANPNGSGAGRVQSNGTNYDVAMYGDYAYVAHELGFDVVDLKGADGPAAILTIPSNGDFQSLTRAGNRLYVTSSGGLSVYDLANPAAPLLLGSAAVTGGQRPAVAGNLVYVAGESKLRIVDASNPASPAQVGSLTVTNGSYRVAVRGNYAYLTTFSSQFHIIDVSNPASPTLAGTVTTNGLTGGVALYGDYLLVGDGNAGLKVFSLANPGSPVMLGEDNSVPGLPQDVEIFGSRAYIGWGQGVAVFEMGNPTQPALVETLRTVRSARAVALGGEFLVAADDQCGLAVFQRGLGGDVDQDGDCDLQDLAMLLANFGTVGGAAPEDGDLDGDGGVDLQDLAMLLASFGQACD